MKTRIHVVLLVLLMTTAARSEPVDFSSATSVTTSFATHKHAEAEALAAKLNLSLTSDMKSFFRLAEKGDWIAVSNAFNKTMLSKKGSMYGPQPVVTNELWAPIHETFGLYEVYADADPSLVQKYGTSILASVSNNSVFFGGSDWGRFVVTAFNDLDKNPKLLVLTQNPLADNRYMSYLRAAFGDRLWIPSTKHVEEGFQEYVEEVRAKKQSLPVKNGQVQVTGVEGVMAINGILARKIFEHNKDRYTFYVEESYVLPWMYPYLEPNGLVMKLNPQPITTLDESLIKQDRQQWTALVKDLTGRNWKNQHRDTQGSFSKLRTAIAGVYAYRKMTEETELGFAQAIELCPSCLEPVIRFATFRAESGKVEEGMALLDHFYRQHPDDPSIGKVMRDYRVDHPLQKDEKEK